MKNKVLYKLSGILIILLFVGIVILNLFSPFNITSGKTNKKSEKAGEIIQSRSSNQLDYQDQQVLPQIKSKKEINSNNKNEELQKSKLLIETSKLQNPFYAPQLSEEKKDKSKYINVSKSGGLLVPTTELINKNNDSFFDYKMKYFPDNKLKITANLAKKNITKLKKSKEKIKLVKLPFKLLGIIRNKRRAQIIIAYQGKILIKECGAEIGKFKIKEIKKHEIVSCYNNKKDFIIKLWKDDKNEKK